jgi:hypothetical protein
MTSKAAASGTKEDTKASGEVPNWDALWAEYQERVAAQKEYHDVGVDIFPTPAFVLKTTLLGHDKKATPPDDKDMAAAWR